MRAAVVEGKSKIPVVRELSVPIPKFNQVLVKVEASPINPSDLGTIRGSYLDKPDAVQTLGFEGSGTVVQSGGGPISKYMLGKKVAFTTGRGGAWSEYVVVPSLRCLPLPDDMSFDQGACSFVNPMTVLAFHEIVKNGKHKAIVHTAAASQLGRMFVRLAKDNKIPLINIVRRQEQVDLLKGLGAEYILNQTDEDFEKKLQVLSTELNATVCFEAVAGELPAKILKNMPKHSVLYLYGALSLSKMDGFDARDTLFNHKTFTGFHLNNWLASTSIFTQLRVLWRLKTLLSTTMKSEISLRVPLEDIVKGLDYYQKNMTLGKVILKPSQAPNETGRKEQ